MSIIKATLRRELLIAFRSPGDIINPLMFFVIAVSLFPLGVGADQAFLSEIAPGVVWVTALLAVMLSMDSLFRADYEDGSLEQLLLSPQPLYFIILAKVSSHWLVSGLPLVILAPVFASMLALPEGGMFPLVAGLLIGTPILTLLGAVGMALTVGLSRSGLLLSVLILPLYIPVLVFGTGIVNSALNSIDISGLLALLGAMLVLALCLAPLAIIAALRISVSL
ncbi:MAG: heme exporter protein CcmB [SAR86 cluster bacterium]|uniref:Heme exporter protein B n=1 Tax=SAR86 cluster bacterium TaxID=2030880 RepID=A0A2A5CD61_9GAMM|nr:heme exporter protein CcmB [Gammaproteobacteria bacterium AH-315-E17]PCJ41451.1 MAG: heme exporter protein CcmB [SAR86 cluster bacterium]